MIGMNREALEKLRAKKEIMIIPGATPLRNQGRWKRLQGLRPIGLFSI